MVTYTKEFKIDRMRLEAYDVTELSRYTVNFLLINGIATKLCTMHALFSHSVLLPSPQVIEEVSISTSIHNIN
jgi:hypothetical protein